ncbi:MAG: ABC transporter permease [bacterium]|nr:ABC transporter permease [bacterium]
MSKFLVVMKREYAQVVKKKSFVVMMFLTPALMAAFMVVPALLATMESSSADYLAVIDRGDQGIGEQFAEALRGYTIGDTDDPAYIVEGVINVDPSDEKRFAEAYDSLVVQVSEQNLKAFLVVSPEAHLADSNLLMVTNSDDFITLRRVEDQLSNIVSSHRIRIADVDLTVDSVLALTRSVDVPIRDTQGEAIPFMIKYFAALIFVMLIYVMIITYGATLMRSIIEEKNSRIIEVLVSSVSPFQLMAGKVVGLGLAAFTQVAVWVVLGAAIFMATSSGGLEIDPAVGRMVFNPVIVTFFLLFFISGYIMYSSLFALIGSIVNSDKEAQNFIFPITISLILPVMVAFAVVRDPGATWVQVLSFIPFIAPTMMLERIVFVVPSLTEYSLFSGVVAEATLSFILVCLTTLGVVWLTAKVFRVGILMYGKRPTLPEIIKWVRK